MTVIGQGSNTPVESRLVSIGRSWYARLFIAYETRFNYKRAVSPLYLGIHTTLDSDALANGISMNDVVRLLSMYFFLMGLSEIISLKNSSRTRASRCAREKLLLKVSNVVDAFARVLRVKTRKVDPRTASRLRETQLKGRVSCKIGIVASDRLNGRSRIKRFVRKEPSLSAAVTWTFDRLDRSDLFYRWIYTYKV